MAPPLYLWEKWRRESPLLRFGERPRGRLAGAPPVHADGERQDGERPLDATTPGRAGAARRARDRDWLGGPGRHAWYQPHQRKAWRGGRARPEQPSHCLAVDRLDLEQL